jgi:hypothetical protein
MPKRKVRAMPFTLNFSDSLLCATHSGSEKAKVTFTDNTSVIVTVIRYLVINKYADLEKSQLLVEIGLLDQSLQRNIRENINRLQKAFHNAAPSNTRLRKPPKSLKIPDNYKLIVKKHANSDGTSALMVGDELKVSAESPFDNLSYEVGTIASFTLL